MIALTVLFCATMPSGCGSGDDEPVAARKPAKTKTASRKSSNSALDKGEKSEAQRKLEMRKKLKQPNLDPPEGVKPRQSRTFSDLLEGDDPADATADQTADKPLDEAAIAAAGLRKISSKHLTLITDLPSSPAVDELPRVFDLAVPQWIDYFKLDRAKLESWNLRVALMKDKEKFKAPGLLPEGLPDFLHGFARPQMAWLYEQPTDYYRRHLLLHEGTHAIMYTALGRAGPPWYSEGLAEHLATHRWADGQLTLRYFPKSREETPGLGRIKIVRDEFAAGKHPALATVMAYDTLAHRKNEPYAWSWAAVAFLDSHPRYRDRFGKLLADVDKDASAFTVAVRGLYETDLAALQEEWQVYIASLEHDYDFERTAIDFTPGSDFSAGLKTMAVAADRGWQNTGVRLIAGKKYQLSASGRFQVASAPRPWMSEANGVSIRYYRERPLGMLLAAVRPDGDGALPLDGGTPSALLSPISIGLAAELAPAQSGTLYFKINDSAGELHDNQGSLSVSIQAKP
ncbi:MAG: hypothetical protein DCC68_25825 [Planctomycetota bacterium]|nr:MAG: hypothetical protein DCC68_25825 [Planctomycetota bacterium]